MEPGRACVFNPEGLHAKGAVSQPRGGLFVLMGRSFTAHFLRLYAISARPVSMLALSNPRMRKRRSAWLALRLPKTLSTSCGRCLR